jgi:hypothetical protein
MGLGCILIGSLLVILRNQIANMRMKWFEDHWNWRMHPTRAYSVASQLWGGVAIIALGILLIVLSIAGE